MLIFTGPSRPQFDRHMLEEMHYRKNFWRETVRKRRVMHTELRGTIFGLESSCAEALRGDEGDWGGVKEVIGKVKRGKIGRISNRFPSGHGGSLMCPCRRLT